jgi:lysophospholipase L1-like esterase
LFFFCLVGAVALFATGARASQTWIVIGDSILSSVPQGTASQMALNLVGNERDVIFKSIASPVASLASNDNSGFNSVNTINTLAQIGGVSSAYNGILIQAGTNDFGRSLSPGEGANALRRVMEHARALKKKILMLDPIWRADENKANSAGDVLNAYRLSMFNVCQEYKDICYFAHREHTVLGASAGAAYYDETEIAAGKQLHPNAIGHRKLADWIEAEAAAAGFF